MIKPDIHFTDTDNDDEFVFVPEDESEEDVRLKMRGVPCGRRDALRPAQGA
jgi:hypothetical protein